jgi:hypothetical protein
LVCVVPETKQYWEEPHRCTGLGIQGMKKQEIDKIPQRKPRKNEEAKSLPPSPIPALVEFK